MDIQLIFKSHTPSSSSGVTSLPIIEKQSVENSCWAQLHRVSIRFQKDESLDPLLMGQLRHQWHGARRTLRVERRKHLKGALQSQAPTSLKKAQAIRSAYLQLSKGLRLLKTLQTSQRKVPKLREQRHAPIDEPLRHLMEAALPYREQLWLQRSTFYRHFYLFLMRQPWLKKGWPLEAGIDTRGQVMDLHGWDKEKSPYRACLALDRAYVALRQLEREVDLFTVKLSPHEMTDNQWQSFCKNQVEEALKSLSCHQEGCRHETCHIDEKGQLACKAHVASSKAWPLPWLAEFQKELQALLLHSK